MAEKTPGFVAEKLDWLFKNRRREDGREYTYGEVAAATGLAKSYVWRIRYGEIKNPGRNALAALSRFFGVHPGFWFTDYFDELPEEELAVLETPPHPGQTASPEEGKKPG